jgi:TM2 domain-containing membrane protein YozV
MKKWQPENQRQKALIPRRLYLIIGFIALLIVGTMAYIFQQTKNIYATHDTMLEVISEIELKYTTAHL